MQQSVNTKTSIENLYQEKNNTQRKNKMNKLEMGKLEKILLKDKKDDIKAEFFNFDILELIQK